MKLASHELLMEEAPFDDEMRGPKSSRSLRGRAALSVGTAVFALAALVVVRENVHVGTPAVNGFDVGETIELDSDPDLDRDEKHYTAVKHFSHAHVKAMAAVTKLSYCGNLPGIHAALASTCGKVCEPAGFYIRPGGVFAYMTYISPDPKVPKGYMFAADVIPAAHKANETDEVKEEKNKFKRGVLLGFMMEDGPNFPIADPKLDQSLTNCSECHVLDSVMLVANAVLPQVRSALAGHACYAELKPCVVRVTGHGMGAAVAQVVAWELAQEKHNIGPSYLFKSPLVGDKAYAKHMNDLFNGEMMGPIYIVGAGKDHSPFVPKFPGKNWSDPPKKIKEWGLFGKQWSKMEACGFHPYYETEESENYSAICLSDAKDCGIRKLIDDVQFDRNKTALVETPCKGPLVPGHEFCNVTENNDHCYLGWPLK